jgi:hypothetical protein
VPLGKSTNAAEASNRPQATTGLPAILMRANSAARRHSPNYFQNSSHFHKNIFGRLLIYIIEEKKPMKTIYSSGEVAKLLKIQPYRLTYAHSIGLQEPMRIFNKRAYSIEDVAALADYFGVELPTMPPNGTETEES